MNLLVLNLKVDANDPGLGFAQDWLNALAVGYDRLDVMTMQTGRVETISNVYVHSVGKEKGFGKIKRVFEFYRILRVLLKNHSYQGCFAHMQPHFAILAWPFLKLKKIPLILWYAHSSVTWYLKLATRLCDNVITASPESFPIQTPKLKIVGHGINTDLFVPPAQKAISKKFVILTAGRIAPVKNLQLLISAAARLKQTQSNFEIQIIGATGVAADRDYEATLRQSLKKLGLEDTVYFLGAKTYREMPAYYQAADCFVNLSDTDSVDKAVLEAMSCGVPVITSNRSYLTVLEGEFSQGVIPKNDEAILCERLQKLMTSSVTQRQELGSRLRQRVLEKHNLKNLVPQIMACVQEVRR